MPKKVIIVGATSGIGLELAKLYINNGDTVGVTGRRNELLTKLQQEFPKQVFTESFDVRGNENIHHLTSLVNKMGGLDMFIYNSGFGDISKPLDWDIDKKTTEINVTGFIEMVNWSFNYFVQKGEGQIAATSSIASIRGNSMAPAYSASKAFMSTYMEGLHMKSRKMKLKLAITDIQPGFVKTKMAKGEGRFWEAPVEKAAKQIFNAINRKKRRVYITRRWALIAWILKWIPYGIYKRIA
jgi:short-subunit dehydrogenase